MWQVWEVIECFDMPLNFSMQRRCSAQSPGMEGGESPTPIPLTDPEPTDAEHSLYVISGEVMVHAGDLETTLQAGDYISIPAGMKHGYRVPADKTALLISMDAPPYDPQKTIRSRDSTK